MGIRCNCPDCGRKLNLKSYLAGKTGVCPHCQIRFTIPLQSTRLSSKESASKEMASGKAGGQPSSPTIATADEPDSVIIQSEPAAEAGSNAAPPEMQTSAAPVESPKSRQAPEPTRPPATAAAYPSHPTIALAPPLAESPAVDWYVRPPTGGQFGPAKGELMQKWLDSGRVASDAFVWREGWADWRRASEVFNSLGSPSPPQLGGATGKKTGEGQSAAPRRRKPKTFAISAIVILALSSIGLLAALVYLMRNQL